MDEPKLPATPEASEAEVAAPKISYVPETPRDKILEIERIAWHVVRVLDNYINRGGDAQWAAAELMVKYLNMLVRQLQVVQELIKSSEDWKETEIFRRAVLDVLAEESPELRQRVARRIRELRESQGVLGELTSGKRRGRPLSPTRERLD